MRRRTKALVGVTALAVVAFVLLAPAFYLFTITQYIIMESPTSV